MSTVQKFIHKNHRRDLTNKVCLCWVSICIAIYWVFYQLAAPDCTPLWPSGIGSRLRRNWVWVRFLAVSDIWLDTEFVLKKEWRQSWTRWYLGGPNSAPKRKNESTWATPEWHPEWHQSDPNAALKQHYWEAPKRGQFGTRRGFEPAIQPSQAQFVHLIRCRTCLDIRHQQDWCPMCYPEGMNALLHQSIQPHRLFASTSDSNLGPPDPQFMVLVSTILYPFTPPCIGESRCSRTCSLSNPWQLELRIIPIRICLFTPGWIPVINQPPLPPLPPLPPHSLPSLNNSCRRT